MIVWASWYMLNLKNSSGAREGWGQGDVRGDTCSNNRPLGRFS